MRRPLRTAAAAVAAALVMVLSACSLHVPTDPDGTLDAVQGGTLRVGATPHAGFVDVAGQVGPDGAVSDDQVSGSEVDLVRGFARELGAEVEFVVSSEGELVRRIEEGSLDLAVGGITSKSPWSSKVGVTRPYTEVVLSDGKKHKLVMLAPMGENAFISELERHLDRVTGKTQAGEGR
ncbi:transporter substrate-binding domain-containing protein [Zhihengliuella alba]|uniref:Transporter substrate-binding domain-containing protein n=1 Tax=Zhihengliuella alba TaxID=547018 RepID=A0ABP7DBU0_9MICC